MPGWFFNLGRMTGQTFRKGKWLFESVTGAEEDIVKAEHVVGRDMASEVQRELGVDADPRVRDLLAYVTPRLVNRVKNKERHFEFWCVPAETPNAFALPGGFIFINRPLIELCGWGRHEIAFVLGHEMAHVIRGHAASRILHDSALNIASRALPVRGPVGGWLKSVGLKRISSAYSQENEFEADALGAKLAIAAGFDPRAALRMLDRLGQLQHQGDDAWCSEYFSTHPPFADRIANLRQVIS